MRAAALLLAVCLACSPALADAPKPVAVPVSLSLQDMTWPEVQNAIKAGYTTVIVPTGGTEQNGPAIVLGKHNYILRYTALATAQKLGHTLVTPIMQYVPEGDIHPPTGHMRFAGTLSLRPETFAAVLEDTARSLKEHGFRTICFLGEHGASQPVQKAVAEKLTAEWKGDGVKVIHVSDYYDDHNGENAWLKSVGETEPDPQAHGGLADTAEMLAANPNGVRKNLIAAHTPADFDSTGAGGSGLHATPLMGDKLLALKVKAAVDQIQKEMQ